MTRIVLSLQGDSYHVGDEGGGNFPGKEVGPVDRFKERMFLQLHLATTH